MRLWPFKRKRREPTQLQLLARLIDAMEAEREAVAKQVAAEVIRKLSHEDTEAGR